MSDNPKKIIVTGSTGLLGSILSAKLVLWGYEVYCHSRSEGKDLRFCISDEASWLKCLKTVRPDVIINLAAETNVDLCEEDPALAFAANVAPLRALKRALLSLEQGVHIIQVSTDQIYQGKGLHKESRPKPCNVYGYSKYAAELELKGYECNTVLRTNFFGLSRTLGRKSFADWILETLRAGERITLFNDVLFSPLHIDTLGYYMRIAFERKIYGVYNVGSSNGISKADFGLHLASILGLSSENILIGSVRDKDLKAKRPTDMRLCLAKFEEAFSVSAPCTIVEIRKYADELRLSNG